MTARGAAAVAAACVAASTAACSQARHGDVVIGVPPTVSTTSSSAAVTIATPPAPSTTTAPRTPRTPRLLIGPDGRPYGAPLVFTSTVPVPAELLFVLVVGSDARKGEDLRRAHADSVHLLAVDPRTRRGTVLGLPRDAWVEIPGHGNGKLTSALSLGGPDLLARTVQHLTGLPVHYWVLTGFVGLAGMVDELGGVDVQVERRMDDRASGAHFQPGWHHFTGSQALSYSRDRHSTPNGDFDRSARQGGLLLATLGKLRAEVSDDDGLQRWVDVLLRHAEIDVPLSQLLPLAALARRLDPPQVGNVVATGRVGHAGSQSVVFLGQEAAAVFLDLRPDAVVGPG
ncbi:MAG TPA: LCP family protein [Acidimicrobiales bacterium]|nr:LCP family protein [Acidimicrobiales bacterium]